MADLTVKAIVQRLETVIAGLSGWALTPLPVGLTTQGTREYQDRSASVMAVGSDVRPGTGDGRRHRASIPAYVSTTVVVDWLARLTADDTRASLAEAYDDEVELVRGLFTASIANMQIHLVSMSREIVDHGQAILGRVTLRIDHTYALS